jgi:hypothetical protein
MKTCPNCRAIHADDYNGTCSDCGKALGGIQANGGDSSLAFSLARQTADARREAGLENALKHGNISGLRLQPSLVDVARSFILVDEEKLAEYKREVGENA